MKLHALLIALVLVPACGTPTEDGVDVVADPRLSEELSVGETNEPNAGKDDDFRHNGEEDFSENCKPIPEVEALEDPEIIVSIDGRTLHLRDRASDYDRVFPVGLGKIGSSGESLSPVSTNTRDGLWVVRADNALVDGATVDRRKWAWNYSCRHWSGTKYYNPASQREEFRSYFAGLPFLRFEGPNSPVYGMHGPIDNYWRENGGELYRGYVSGGCTRMDPDDLVEVYGRIRGTETPVRVQTAIEFDEAGLSIDSDRFMGAHCMQDADCADPGAVCATHPTSEFSFCTAPCAQNSECPIRPNEIVGSIGVLSFCVADTKGVVDGDGYCVVEGNGKTNNDCRSYPAPLTKQRLALLDDADRRVSVCALP